ncbi:MAG: chromate transporter [Pseudonocardiales bacterium]|jgi:chromate transporter|nr:chromate transporter [Pseudonocardiales bacterium]
MTVPPPSATDVVPFRLAVRAWFAISLQTFGGPAGQIAVMQRELVDQRRWIGPKRFQHALNYCMLLPGPEAQQLAIYIGWLLNGTRGGLAAGTLFVLPGVVAMAVLSSIYVTLGTTSIVTAVLTGLGAAVLAIVADAVVRVGKRALAHPALVGLAIAAFLALEVFAVPFPLVVLVAGLIGWSFGRWTPQVFADRPQSAAAGRPDEQPLISDELLHVSRPTAGRALKVIGLGLVLWATPVAALALATGGGSILTHQGVFFSGTAVVTFGGAYAVLSYVAQKAVVGFHWLTASEMVSGLALAETTPGPLIMVVQFVAFVAAYRHPGTLDPWLAATLGSAITVWVTFVPCFLFIFLGAPYVERLRGNRSVAAALGGITAAVVGVIANLAVYFAVHILFRTTGRRTWGPIAIDLPHLDTIRPIALTVAVIAAVLIFAIKWSVLRTLGVCAAIGLLLGVTGIHP